MTRRPVVAAQRGRSDRSRVAVAKREGPRDGPSSRYHRRVSRAYAQLAHLRRFNRTITQRIGALNDHFLSRDRPLAMSRLLWEIGTEGGEVVMLRSRLGRRWSRRSPPAGRRPRWTTWTGPSP